MGFRRTLASTAIALALVGFAGAPAIAGTVESWNLNNVDPSTGPDLDGNYYSVIYDSTLPDAGAATSGYIKYTPPEGGDPGLVVVNDAPDLATSPGSAVDNCIMAVGADCNGPFQSGKRFKLDRTAFDPIDLVFNVDPDGSYTKVDNDGLYKVFQKYGNASGESIDSFSIQLGFGVGDGFVGSSDGDGLGFVDFSLVGDGIVKNNEFSSLFAAGLFGPVDAPEHPLAGYFDNLNRAGFNLSMVGEDLFQSTGMFGSYEALFGDWMSYSQAPDGYFYDDDGDPLTDAILMAHYDAATGTWIMNRSLDADGMVVTVADGNDGTVVADVGSVEAALVAAASNVTLLSCEDPGYVSGACLAGVGAIEDLAKFNLTYFLEQMQLDINNPLLFAAYPNDMTFTLRVTAEQAVPAPGALALLGLGLLGLFGTRRRAAMHA
jgi:hypothetical protein